MTARELVTLIVIGLFCAWFFAYALGVLDRPKPQPLRGTIAELRLPFKGTLP